MSYCGNHINIKGMKKRKWKWKKGEKNIFNVYNDVNKLIK